MSYRYRNYGQFRPYGSNRRAKGNRIAANQQRDTTTVVINTNVSFDCGQTMVEIFNDRGDKGWFDTGCAAINVYDVLRKSDYFNQFSSIYDQVKIESIKAKIIATNWATSKEESQAEEINEVIKAKSYIIVTAWDRSCLGSDQVVYGPKWEYEDIFFPIVT